MAVDPISGALISAGAKEIAGPTKSAITSMGRAAYDSLAVKFEGCFQGHVQATHDKCSQIKNLLYRDQSTDFKSKYVSVNFTRSKKVVSDSGVLSFVMDNKNVIISGTAGAGKTMFMRWAALSVIEGIRAHGRIPLYLEMRYTSQSAASKPFENYLYEKTSSIRDKASFGQFVNGLKSGLFVVLLDAIDEVSPGLREDIVASIIKFSEDYPICSIIMSSRPDDYLTAIQSFSVYRTQPMNLNQIKEVISKLEWNQEVKSKLITKLDAGVYKDIKEFLSNPLLATILLITFDDAAEIPTRLTLFYQQAFEVLYQRHDATKGAYKRNLHANLSMGEYQNFFATFCFQTYIDYKVEFNDVELITAFKDAADYIGTKAAPDDLIRDSMESACLLQKEGLDNVFVHRSFQDYFCAHFVANYKEDDVKDLVDAVSRKEDKSNALRMLYELSPETFDYEWLLPILDEFLSKFGRINLRSKTGLKKFMQAYSDGLYIGVGTGEVEYTSWGSMSRGSDQKIGKWMSAIEWATRSRNLGQAEVYKGRVWDSLEDYLNNIPVELLEIVGNVGDRIETSPFTKDDEEEVLTIGVSAQDAPWLIHSGLPDRFEAVRRVAKARRDAIIKRREQRRSTVKQILKRRTGSAASN